MAIISKSELEILGYLRENVRAFGERYKLAADDVANGLGIDKEALEKDASYLAEYGLVGMSWLDASGDGIEQYWFVGIYLTGFGEGFVRELEQRMQAELEKVPDQPASKAKKFGVRAASFLFDTGADIVARVATEYLARALGPPPPP